MHKLTRESLYSLEKYSDIRSEFRKQVMEHKKNRRVQLGEHVALYFEDHLTMQYQVQEMLRIEKIFDAGGIEEELAAYNPLIPDGSNWKATMMIEYDDVDQRKQALEKLKGVEDKIWVKVAALGPVWAIADEDLERESEEKTSAVHFLRFELTEGMAIAVKGGAPISMGVDHSVCSHKIDPVSEDVRQSLAHDIV